LTSDGGSLAEEIGGAVKKVADKSEQISKTAIEGTGEKVSAVGEKIKKSIH
jgi:hypothetical protein